jgi:lysophospholipase L1-like esterase
MGKGESPKQIALGRYARGPKTRRTNNMTMKHFTRITSSLILGMCLSLMTIFTSCSTNPPVAQRIVVLGSSTAAGYGLENPDSSWVNRYRTFLQKSNPEIEVINLAKGGYTTYELMPSDYVTPESRPRPDSARNITRALALSPTAIIINLPSNDAAVGVPVNTQLANYDTILARTAALEIPVWITTTQPRNLPEDGRQNLMAMRDSTLIRFGDKAIDFWSDLADEQGLITPIYDSGDGVHFNATGHQLLFQRVTQKAISNKQ